MKIAFVIGVMAMFCSTAHGQTLQAEYPATGAEIGFGYDTYSGEFFSSGCVRVDGRIPLPELLFADQNAELRYFETIEEASDTSSGGISGGFTTPTIGISGSQANAAASQMSRYSTFFSIKSTVLYREMQTVDRARGYEVLRRKNENDLEFRRRCGTHFVSGFRFGADLRVFFNLKASSNGQQKTDQSSLGGSAGNGAGLSGSLGVSTAAQVNSLLQNRSYEISSFRNDRPVEFPRGEPGEIVEWARGLAPRVRDDIAALGDGATLEGLRAVVILRPYPETESPLPDPNAYEAYRDLLRLRFAINSLTVILNDTEQFLGLDSIQASNVQKLIDYMELQVTSVKRYLRLCGRQDEACPEYTSAEIPVLPARPEVTRKSMGDSWFLSNTCNHLVDSQSTPLRLTFGGRIRIASDGRTVPVVGGSAITIHDPQLGALPARATPGMLILPPHSSACIWFSDEYYRDNGNDPQDPPIYSYSEYFDFAPWPKVEVALELAAQLPGN